MPQSIAPDRGSEAARTFAASGGAPSPSEALDNALYRKVSARVIPFLFICYVVSFLDRINIGFAQLQMKHDPGFSDAMYGLGAAVFYVGYLLFEVTNKAPYKPAQRACSPPPANTSL